MTARNHIAHEGLSRRKFGTAAAAGAGLAIVPRHVLGRGFTPPSDLLNVAGVGGGGMGRSNILSLASQNIVALCDVDWDYAGRAFDRLDADLERQQSRLKEAKTDDQRRRSSEQIDEIRRMKEQMPKVKRYRDYREMLEKKKDIDAVVIATPDHTPAIIAMAAMDLNKHVYVQKPLTWSVHEARELARKAKEKKLATQMGNQGHSDDDGRKVKEYIVAGAIGDVREVHVWTNRPLTHWPQGIPRPEAMKSRARDWR